jgi:hypothetical protein
LIPVTILYDGQFYDATAYKASPVPMALESGTVYEGLRTGVSQGFFTVAGALQLKNTWIGEGTWRAAGEAAAKKAIISAKAVEGDADAPPRLRHGPEKPAEPEPAAHQPTVPQAAPAPPASAPTPAPPAAAAAAPSPAEEDHDRPVLRRGTQTHPPEPPTKAAQSQAKGASPGLKQPAKATSGASQVFPAISDAGGPDPMPYTYDLKPEEEQQFRQKMLGLAAEEVRARAKLLASGTITPEPPAPRRSKATAKFPQPSFEDVQLRIFDLTSNNEPVLVLTAKARMPQTPKPTGTELQYFVTLVARNDIYGELHKALANVTDTQHLDVVPRLELIDAVDADGDGRGDLLFRQVSDAGSVFVVDRVVGDRVDTLFEGTP